MKLYEATADMQTVNDWIDEHGEEVLAAGGELPPELRELLELAEGQLKDKVERVAFYIRRLEGEQSIITGEVKRLQDRARVKGNAVQGLKDYLQRCLEAAGETKVETPLITVSVQKSPPSVQHRYDLDMLIDCTLLHEAGLLRTKEVRSLDSKLAIERWKAGEPLPDGITVVVNTHLRIR